MSRIYTNVQSVEAITALEANQNDLNVHLQRLSTGLQINSGADAPAGLIASQEMQSEMAGLSQAIDNNQQAGNVINTADGALSEVSSMLLELQSLTNEAANTGAMSSDEIAANQSQVDSILNSINRISNTTSFNGVKLLNGSLGYTTSGVAASAVTNATINAAQIPTGGYMNVAVTVTTSAQLANVQYNLSGIGASATTISVTGALGTEQLSFAASTHNSAIAAAINQVSGDTGVSATVQANGHLSINSTKYGASQFVSVKSIGSTGSFATTGTGKGRDAVISINGTQADVNGTDATVTSGGFDVDLSLTSAFITKKGAESTFKITGGGLTFQIGGNVDLADQMQIGINSTSTSNLGNSADGFLSDMATGGSASLTSGNTTKAQQIINDAIDQISTLRGRLGAYQKDVIDSNTSSLQVTLENVTSSESDITDADFATETAAMTRDQILIQATTSVLSTANSEPDNVLSLLSH